MTLPADTITARMQTLLGEAAPSTDSKEKIIRDYLEYVPKEIALLKKMQAQATPAFEALEKALTHMNTFIKYTEGLKRPGSELDALTDEMGAIKARAEKLSEDDLGDLEDTILWGSFGTEDLVYSDRLNKTRQLLSSAFERISGYENEAFSDASKQIKSLEGKVQAAKKILGK